MPCSVAIQIAAKAATVAGSSERDEILHRIVGHAQRLRAADLGKSQARHKVPSATITAMIEGSGGKKPGGKAGQRPRQRRDRRAIGGDHRDAAEIEHAGERDDKRRDADAGHPQPCHTPMATPPAIATSHPDQRLHIVLDGEQSQDDADQRHRRADGQIEIAGDDQHHRADRGQADDRGLQREQDEIALGEEGAVGGEVEEQPRRRRAPPAASSCAAPRPEPASAPRRFRRRDRRLPAFSARPRRQTSAAIRTRLRSVSSLP